LFDSDNDDNLVAASGESDEDPDSEADLYESEDDLKCFKGDPKRLKEALALESRIPCPTVSDGDSEDDLQPRLKSHYRTPTVPKKAMKTTKGVPSKREVKREQEKPTWRDSAEDASDSQGSKLVNGSRPRHMRTNEEDWPASSRIVFSTSGKPEGRISHFRNHVRKVAQAHVATHYGLTKGADTKVADLLKKNMFIYPVNSKDEPIRSKPYKAPAILDTIGDAFFGDDTSMGTKFHEKFVSTVEDRQDERELPVAMVALAGTAVRSVIMQYSSEKYDRDFNCELYSGIYKTLVGILNGIFETSEHKYHVLMHSIYNTV
ncbi:hypothetical protein P692DRAFT_20657383, partial [Suillus brevipes Sb2]